MGTGWDGCKPARAENAAHQRVFNPNIKPFPMPSSDDAPNADIRLAPHAADYPTAALPIALRALADTGYGLWMLQGAALALGIFRSGRSESLVPLSLGALFVSLGLLLAVARVPGVPDWRGWRPGRGHRPGPAALVAMATYLPMLAVAGLTRGENHFLPTRLAGVALMLGSLGCLLYRTHRQGDRSRDALRLSVGRVVSALYGGGLWLWASAAAGRDAVGIRDPASQLWLLLLLALALLLGLLEGTRWHTLRPPTSAAGSFEPVRLLAAVLTYAVPCLAVLFTDKGLPADVAALIAAPSCLLGRMLERRALARLSDRGATSKLS